MDRKLFIFFLLSFFLVNISYPITDSSTTFYYYYIPYDTLPLILNVNVTPDNPTTAQDLNCSFIIQDENNLTINWNATWYIDNIINDSWDLIDQSADNDTLTWVSVAPVSDNTSVGEYWKCEITAWEGEGTDALNGTELIYSIPIENGGGGTPPTEETCKNILVVSTTNITIKAKEKYYFSITNNGQYKHTYKVTSYIWEYYECSLSDTEFELSRGEKRDIYLHCDNIPIFTDYDSYISITTEQCATSIDILIKGAFPIKEAITDVIQEIIPEEYAETFIKYQWYLLATTIAGFTILAILLLRRDKREE